MGKNKAFLDWNGEVLWRRQARILQEAGASPVMLSGPSHAAWVGWPVVEDERLGLGPLAGIVGALRRGVAPLLLVLAVDLPRMEASILARLIQGSDPERGAVFQGAQGWEPLAACYPHSFLSVMEEELMGGRGAPRAVVERMVAEKRMTVFPVLETEVWLNANTREEWEKMKEFA